MSQQQQYPTTPMPAHEHEMPGLAGIANVIRWFENLIMLLSGPVLTVSLGIAIVGLMTNDKVMTAIPALLYIWAVSQAIGIDSQLVAAWDRVRIAGRNHDWLALVGYLILGVALGYIGFLSAAAFGFQNAFAVSEAQALARLGIDPNNWQLQRAILAVALVALSGLLRYHPPAKNHSARAADEAERLQAEIDLAPLRAQLQAAKLRQVRSGVTTLLGREGQQQQGARVAVAATLPESQPTIHHQYHTPIPTHKAMHEGWSDEEIMDEYADEIADEVEDESDLFSTRKIPAVSSRPVVASQPATNDTKQRTPRGLDSGVKRGNSDRSKSLRKANADLRAEAKRLRRSRIRDAAYAVLDEWYASGQSERLSDKELTRRVQARVDFDVNPSGNTVARWRGPWQSSRAHKAVMEAANLNDVAPMEPQELRELQEVW